jgi:uncharacterized integral membrane protein (TIGR00697 family)
MKKMVSVPFMVMGIIFVVCLIVANFLETKIVRIGPVTATAGLMIFPVSYIINDCIAEVYGFKKARLIIWTGFAMNFFAVGMAQLAILLPAPGFWQGEESFNFVFGLTPRIVAGSLCAFLAGSFLNAYIMSKMKIMLQGGNFSLRAVVSTLVGETADSFIFFPVAFAGIIPNNALLIMIITQAILKSVYEILVLPLTVRVVAYVKKIEGIDTFDNNISFNPFKVKDL